MIDAWIALPLEFRYVVLALVGLASGGFANYLIYSWCYFPRHISPHAPPHPDAPRRSVMDRVPVIGWFGLRRESGLHGRGFWIRPLLIELSLAIALPALYWFETQVGGLFPEPLRIAAWFMNHEYWMTRIFLLHGILVVLMTAATFIDFDEQTIPDVITVPGTLLALVSGAISPLGFMPAVVDGGVTQTTFNLPWIPADPSWFDAAGLWTGLAIWSGWCFALADRRVILRRGWMKAIEYFFAGLVRHPSWKILFGLWLVGLVAVAIVFNMSGPHWHGLLSALIGLAVGGGIVWIVRIVASSAMGMEAMGFGDVTIMAMIGAVIGWQASLAAFFISPFAAIAIVIIQYIVTRQPRVPFGPYLCAGTLITILGWGHIYNELLAPNLALGQFLVALAVFMFILMGVFLFVWRKIKTLLFY